MVDAPATIATGKDFKYTVPAHFVEVAEKLGGPWSREPFLYCNRLRVACAPDVDFAELEYRYGPGLREDGSARLLHEQLNINGKFLKITIPKSGLEEEDYTWFGIVELDDRNVHGSFGTLRQASGIQKITALGLIRLLDRQIILESYVHNPNRQGDVEEPYRVISMGVPFNQWRGGEYFERGNRSDQRVNGPNSAFVFSNIPQRTNLWNAFTAAEYLLEYFAPKDILLENVVDWRLEAEEESLSWYDVSLETDSRSVKQVLDDLINRRRGVGYFVWFDELAGECVVQVFTFIDKPLLLKSGNTLAPNPNQTSLDFEKALDVDVRLVNQVSSQFDVITVLGAWQTSTITLSFNPNLQQVEKDWTADEEQEYKDAASADVDYVELQELEKARRNKRFRHSKLLRHVFTRFQISPDWNQRVVDVLDDDGDIEATEYFAAPISSLLSSGGVDLIQYDPKRANTGQTLWNEGIELEPVLPLKDRLDYSGSKISESTYSTSTGDGEPQHIPPMVFVRTSSETEILNPDTEDEEEVTVNKWEFLERLADSAVFEDANRRWGGHVRVLDQRPAFEIHLSGVPQHFISTAAAEEFAKLDPMHDPNKEAGIEYTEDLLITLCVRVPHRVSESASVRFDADQEGKQLRTLYQFVADARLDYVAPKTVVDIENGSLLQSEGGFVRDDRARLADIARATAEWYGRPRQTIMLRARQLREFVRLGWLIKDVGPEYQLTGVNTVITGLAFDFQNVVTEFETSFAELEFD